MQYKINKREQLSDRNAENRVKKEKRTILWVCKISGKIEFSHHGFVMAFFHMRKAKKKPRTMAGRGLFDYRFLELNIGVIFSEKCIVFSQSLFRIDV